MNRNIPTIEFFTASDGYRCANRVWSCEDPRGRVVVVHGIVSHGGWYLSSCRHLLQAGFEVHALDRRGSGLNMAARGDVDRHSTWLSDVESYLVSLPQKLPTVLVGISWGGKFIAALAKRLENQLAGIALICPGLFAFQQVGWWKQSALHAARWLGLGKWTVPIPLQDPQLFTESPDWCNYISRDPLTLRRVTVDFARADLQLNQVARAGPEQIHLPVLLMLAGRERIVDNVRTRQYFDRISSTDKTCIEYPNAGHTLEFEPNPAEYQADLAAWIGRIVERADETTIATRRCVPR